MAISLAWVQSADTSLGLSDLPAPEVLRQIWIQQYYHCTVPGLEALRWRTGDEQPPAAVRIASPYDLEARYSSKRETHWVGYKLHLTETCDADHPDLITQVMTTPATTQDSVMGPAIQQDLADRDLFLGYTYSTAAMWTQTYWLPPRRRIRSMWWVRRSGPTAGNRGKGRL